MYHQGRSRGRRQAVAIFIAPLAALALASCGSEASEKDTPETTVTQTVNESPTMEEESTEEAQLPDMVGKSLQDAQDSAQAAGFYNLASHDATGMDRLQVLDRNWKVCSQEPQAGTLSTDTQIDFGAVKQDEACP
ncbi:PASTA domain-containing protein [Streptomyces purpurogeneiscleroticus]|uniref:PASTA domain-containing protein n=1 Tax=Streptomyces purpurogeneiscleroticus TaxID=68259 RepID=UPI001CBC46E8|nr:PASTA domain-containing protein [Streptomyces purpurogeneiscleroticus]MBZ4017509.1 hypothetical protein [Streptomyces purpurogeneiscleroticus]